MNFVNIDERNARSYWTIGRGDSERAFRSAKRHSARVRLLRTALPLLIGLALVGVVLNTYLNPLFDPLPVQVGKVALSGTRITMDHPRIAGFTHDERPYALTAETAIQDLKKPNAVELHNIKATVQMQDLGKLQLTAPMGLYDTKKEILKLDQNILITSSKGYEGRLREATVDIGSGHVTSDHPVEMKMLQGTLDANRMEIINSGDLIKFDRGVRMTLRQGFSKDSAKPATSDRAPIQLAGPPPLSDESVAAHDPVPNAIHALHHFPPVDPRRLAPTRQVAAAATVLIRLPKPRPGRRIAR
jgi:lipopolysaccharide export system protein LptC